jgi:hypothetical protein
VKFFVAAEALVLITLCMEHAVYEGTQFTALQRAIGAGDGRSRCARSLIIRLWHNTA